MYDSTSRSYCLSSNSPPECSAAPVSARPSDAPSPSGRARHTRSASPPTSRILVSNVADTSDFAGSVRCAAPGEGMFTGVAVELDAVNQIFTTLPVVPVPERMSQE